MRITRHDKKNRTWIGGHGLIIDVMFRIPTGDEEYFNTIMRMCSARFVIRKMKTDIVETIIQLDLRRESFYHFIISPECLYCSIVRI